MAAVREMVDEAYARRVRLLQAAPEGEGAFDVVLLGFKPQQLPDATAMVRPYIGPQTLLLSILAGVLRPRLVARPT